MGHIPPASFPNSDLESWDPGRKLEVSFWGKTSRSKRKGLQLLALGSSNGEWRSLTSLRWNPTVNKPCPCQQRLCSTFYHLILKCGWIVKDLQMVEETISHKSLKWMNRRKREREKERGRKRKEAAIAKEPRQDQENMSKWKNSKIVTHLCSGSSWRVIPQQKRV